MASNPLKELYKYGQSFWYDNIRRALLTSGELKRMVDEDGLRGMTSNPTIFAKAIAGSADYDETIRRNLGSSPEAIFIEVALEDIRAACDILRPVYDSSGGTDGFVSMEVFPNLARDAEGTVEQARLFWNRIQRPNAMIKVPSTPECIPVIRQLLSEGININITLMFGFDSYRDVVEDYLSALEDRVSKGQPIDRIASVASLFVSRVDTRVDKMLDELAKRSPARAAEFDKLRGKAGIANARRMYKYFLEVVNSERFKKLAAKGAHKQRLLWASTSTKDPRFPDTLYADALIGPDTVDTMPDVTIHAFRDHGHPTERLTKSLNEAKPVLDAIAAAGIDFEKVLRELQDEGVDLFQASFDELIQCLRDKVYVLQAGGAVPMKVEMGSEALASKYKSTLQQLEKGGAIAKIWRKDPSLWTNDAAVANTIKNRLGWLNVGEMMLESVPTVIEFVQGCRRDGLKDVVLLGMGGSSLAPEVFTQVFGPTDGGLRLYVLDTTDPVTIARVESVIDLAHTLFVVSSKSGGTIEPNSLFAYFWERINGLSQDGKNPGNHFAAITDDGTSLQRLAREHKFRHTFVNPSDIGGRYSALSYFGLVPAALLGIDIHRLLERSEVMVHACATCVSADQNPGSQLGAAMAIAQQSGRDKLTLITSPRLRSFGMWLEQLLAESTGKQGTGIVPIDGEPAAAPSQYGKDRIFAYLRLDTDPAGNEESLVAQQTKAGAPIVTIHLRDVYDLGQEFFRWELAAAVAGSLLGIDPFDEPNVKESKDNTNRVIEEFTRSGAKALESQPVAREGALTVFAPKPLASARDVGSLLQQLLDSARPGDYVALMAYFDESESHNRSLLELRQAIREHWKLATTLGYGPRFLHSTGQLHKGGPNSGIFLQLTAARPEDRNIPGHPYSFATLFAAQALGDYQSLVSHDRRVVRIDLGDAVDAGLLQLLTLLTAPVAQRA